MYNATGRSLEDVLGSIYGAVENVVLLGGRYDWPKQRVSKPEEREYECWWLCQGIHQEYEIIPLLGA